MNQTRRTTPGAEFVVDALTVQVCADADEVGRRAAAYAGRVLRERIAEVGSARVVFATGNSQLPFVRAIRAEQGVRWDVVTGFHMDEYVGIAADHPASFRRWIATNLADGLGLGEVHYLRGDAPDAQVEADRYAGLLRAAPLDLVVMGIGENGHIAFNEPDRAPFDDPCWARVVDLDDRSRRQQVGEGHFASLDDVPTAAITLTVPALLAPTHVLVSAPEARKAVAVRATLTGPVSPQCPASALRTRPATLLLDPESAALLA